MRRRIQPAFLLMEPFARRNQRRALGLRNSTARRIVRHMELEVIRRAVEPACRAFHVRRLDVFGSAARGSATPASDLDLLVEFTEPTSHAAKRFFGLLHSLEDTLGCEIDLLTPPGLRNPYFRKRVLEEKVPLYEG